MRKIFSVIILSLLLSVVSAQKIEKVYFNSADSTADMFIAVLPTNLDVNSFMFLLDGFGASPADVLIQTNLPNYAATKGILTILPVLKTGPLYFGSDSKSQESLKSMIEMVVRRYQLNGKKFYIGGFSIGGNCALKYAELAVQKNYPVKPTAAFAIDPPLDWERFYQSAKRVVRLSKSSQVNGEVTYMINRIEKEIGTPQTALKKFYEISPYSYSDTTQQAIKNLVDIPVMLITEPDIQWWLANRGYDYTYMNATEMAAMVNELQKLGNKNAVLKTTSGKGYRLPGNIRHPHSWSIADPSELINWLQSFR